MRRSGWGWGIQGSGFTILGFVGVKGAVFEFWHLEFGRPTRGGQRQAFCVSRPRKNTAAQEKEALNNALLAEDWRSAAESHLRDTASLLASSSIITTKSLHVPTSSPYRAFRPESPPPSPTVSSSSSSLSPSPASESPASMYCSREETAKINGSFAHHISDTSCAVASSKAPITTAGSRRTAESEGGSHLAVVPLLFIPEQARVNISERDLTSWRGGASKHSPGCRPGLGTRFFRDLRWKRWDGGKGKEGGEREVEGRGMEREGRIES